MFDMVAGRFFKDPTNQVLLRFSDLLFLLDREGNVADCNEIAEKRTGYSHRDLKDKPFLQLFPAYQHAEIRRWLENSPGEQRPPLYLKLLTREEDSLYLQCKLALPDPTSNDQLLIRAIEVTSGIFPETEKSLAEEMFFKAFHSNPALMAISRFENSEYVDVNDSFLQSLGYEREEIIGKTSSELQLFVDLVQSDKFLRKLRKLSKVRDFDVTIQTKDGEKRHGLFSAEVIMLQGEPCLLTIINDITERKQAQKELELSESRYRLVLEHMSNCMVVYQTIDEGRDFRIVEFNEAAEKVEKRKRKDVIDRKLSESFPQAFNTGFNRILEEVNQTGVPKHSIISFVLQDGNTAWRENFVYKLPTL